MNEHEHDDGDDDIPEGMTRDEWKEHTFPFRYGIMGALPADFFQGLRTRPEPPVLSLQSLLATLRGIPKYTVVCHADNYEMVNSVLADYPHIRVKKSEYVPTGRAIVIDENAALRVDFVPERLKLSELFEPSHFSEITSP